MNWINTIKSSAKNFWELFYTLINYLFGLNIAKGDLKINPTTYFFDCT